MNYREEYLNKTRKKGKYKNKRRDYNGKWYDSILEANYAEELDWKVKLGDIQSWDRQVKIDIRVNDTHITNYFIDFKVVDKHGGIQYIEVKGFEAEVWKIKWRLVCALKDELLEPGAELIVIKKK